MRQTQLNILQRIWLACLWQSMRLFAMLPHWFKYYVVENVIFFLLYYCLRYRMAVVKENLRNSFPEKSDFERLVIRRRFYRTLSEMFVDTINMAHMSERKIRRVLEVKNLEEHRRAIQGRDWIAMLAHFGCWEYGSFWGVYDPTHILASVYHPLRDKVMDEVYKRLRNRGDYSLSIPMANCMRFYLDHRAAGFYGKNIVLGLIADQNPPRRPDSHWFRFLNQDTIFFDGAEKLALRYHLPVYFVKMERLARGRYRIGFEMIYDGQEPVAPNEITERYVRHLESMICEHPELWMWSHRRWKHKRTNVDS